MNLRQCPECYGRWGRNKTKCQGCGWTVPEKPKPKRYLHKCYGQFAITPGLSLPCLNFISSEELLSPNEKYFHHYCRAIQEQEKQNLIASSVPDNTGPSPNTEMRVPVRAKNE